MESPGYSIGSFASFDNEGGECADGDVIHVLDHDEGIPCVDQIVDACERLGHPIPKV